MCEKLKSSLFRQSEDRKIVDCLLVDFQCLEVGWFANYYSCCNIFSFDLVSGRVDEKTNRLEGKIIL